MLQDILTICWKEWREYLVGRGGGRWSGGLRSLAIILIVGALLPWNFGVRWAISPLALLFDGLYFPLILVLTVVADSFAGERERHTLETLLASRLSDRAILLGKCAAITSYGWLFGLVAAAVGLLAANLGDRNAAPFVYAPAIAIGIVVFGLLSSALMAGAGCLVSLRAPTMRQAQQTLSMGFAVLFFGGMIGMQALPASERLQLIGTVARLNVAAALAGLAALLLIVDGLLLILSLARFRRGQLILE